jgi:hypothetical protein
MSRCGAVAGPLLTSAECPGGSRGRQPDSVDIMLESRVIEKKTGALQKVLGYIRTYVLVDLLA